MRSIENGLTSIKVTILQFGNFKTRILEPESSPNFPVHPAYTDPMQMGNIIRGLMNSGHFGDTGKATSMLFHKLASDPGTSLRVAVGQDANNFIKQQLKKVEADVTKYESWSDNLD